MDRRTFLAGSVSTAFLAACGGGGTDARRTSGDLAGAVVEGGNSGSPTQAASSAATDTPVPPAPTATATPSPTPVPRGRETRLLLPGTAWESATTIRHAGVNGPAVVVLGGVHGNEPGAWTAADAMVDWEPATGTLIVLPRANHLAINAFERTFPELGDLNRLYPGNPESTLPMERMAHEILELCREFRATLLLDMHESWAFYAEYPGTGTGALGQTLTIGAGGTLGQSWGQALIDAVNPTISAREEMLLRDGSRFRRNDATAVPGSMVTTNRGRSSLSAGGHVPGLTPVLVEMGQEHQELERRVELHHIVARAALESLGVL